MVPDTVVAIGGYETTSSVGVDCIGNVMRIVGCKCSVSR